MKEERIVSLDALRGLAAFAVAIPHFTMAEMEFVAVSEAVAAMAVEVFFILSGFVLAPQILYCMESNSVRRFEIFLARRWMRTLPLFALALSVTAGILYKFGKNDFYEYLFFVRNFFEYKVTGDFFPVAWSLAIEEWFYVLFPCLLLGGRLLGLNLFRTVTIFFGVFFIIRALSAAFAPSWDVGTHRVVVARLDAIAFGFCLYCACNSRNGSLVSLFMAWVRRHLHVIFVLSFLLTILYLYLYVTARSMILSFLYFYITSAFSACILLYFYEYNRLFKGNPLLSRLSAFTGAISYSVYLFHYAIIVILKYTMSSETIMMQFAVFLVAVVTLSYFLRISFEKPILSVRPNYRTALRLTP